MRGIEYLIQLFPDKTGKELLAIQEQDKLDDQKEFERFNKKLLAIIKDINENGGYFCGRFGSDQRYFRKIYDLTLENGEIYMTVDEVVFFINDTDEKHSVTNIGEAHFERRINKTYKKYDQYGLTFDKRVTVKEWDEVNEYINNMTKFWAHIKPV